MKMANLSGPNTIKLDQDITTLRDNVSETKEEVTTLRDNVSETKEEVITLRREISKTQEEINKEKNSLFTLLGLFTSLVTFISVEIQILKTACSGFTLAGLSLITLGGLGIFVVLIDYIGKSWWKQDSQNKISKIIFLIVLGLFVVGCILICLGREQQCKENEIYQKFENEYGRKIIELENKIENRNRFSEFYF